MGARWILKRVKMEAISAPTNWKIIVLKFLIWLSKAIVESNIDNREKDVKHILEKRKFRIQLGIICFGIIAFIALLVGIMPD